MDERKRWVAEMARSAPQYAADFLDEIPFGKLEGPVREANLTELKHHVADRRGVFVVHQCAFAPYRGDRPGPVVATRSFEAAEVAAK